MSVNKNCTWNWFLTENGTEIPFPSEKALNTYLQNKYMSQIETKSDKVFEKSNIKSKTEQVLHEANEIAKEKLQLRRDASADAMRKKEMTIVDNIESKTIDDSPAEAWTDNFEPVSEYVYNMAELTRLDIDKYVENRKRALLNNPLSEDRRKIEEVKRLNPELTEEDEIISKVIEQDIKQWKSIRKAGKALDKIFGIIINQKGQYEQHYLDTAGKFNIQAFIDDNAEWKNSEGESWYDLEGMYHTEVKENGTEIKVSPVIQSFVDQVIRLKRNHLNIKYTDKVFYQYVADYATSADKSTGIRGKMDIVIVRQGGRVDIYDIKTSIKSAGDLGEGSEWDIDKIKATEYQLGFYGRMIENLGIDPSRINLNVIPIKLNQSGTETENISLGEPIKIIPRTSVDQFIRQTIPIELKSSVEAETMRSDLKSYLEKMFPTIQINNQILNVHDRYFIETFKIRKEGSKWRFDKHLRNSSQVVYSDTEEEAIEKYKEYLIVKQEDSNSWFRSIKGYLRSALEDFGKSKNDIFETLFANQLPANIQLNFKKYFTNEGWEIAELSKEITDVLDGLNTIVLYNPKTGVHDIVSLSSLDLDRQIHLKKGDSIFGNYKTNEQSRREGNDRKASVGNVLLMRNMAIGNMLSKYIPNLDFVFGDISVFNSRRDEDTSLGKYWSLPASELIEDSMLLHSLSGVNSSINASNVASIDVQIMNLFDQILRATNETEFQALPGAQLTGKTLQNVRGFFKDVNSLENTQDKLETLNKLWKLLVETNPSKDISLDQLIESKSMNGYIYREVARLFALSSNTFMDLYNVDVLSKLGLENWKQAINQRSLLNGSLTMTIDTIPIVATIHDAIQKINQRIRSDFERYKNKENRDMFELGGLNDRLNLSTMSIKKFYDMTPDGKRLFLFKNPDTDTSLTPNEKKFLTWYLEQVNTLREGHALNDAEIAELKSQGVYFQVPLGRVTAYSRFMNANKKSVKDLYQDTKSSIFNLRNAVIGQEEYFEDSSDYRDMVTMYNTFKASDSAREKLISNANGDNFAFFQSDLQEILDTFKFSEIKSKQYDTILPAVTAAVASLQALGYASGVDVKESYDFINKHLKSAIFNESLLPQNELIKTIATVKSHVSGAILGFNMLSGAKEVMNGILYHYTRAVAAKIDKDKVGVGDMSRAYTTVWVDSMKQISTITKQEKLNFRFGISNMDTNSIVENQNYYKTDPLRFKYLMYWTNRAPDFLNRMTILTGYMYKYGCYDAYSVDKDTEELKYDWRKDERFSLIASNDQSNMTEYLEQRALYSKMMEDLIDQGFEYVDPKSGIKRALKWNPNNFNDQTNDELPEGFTNRQIKAIKEESDRAFGYMDHDTKSMMFKSGITAVFFQFKTFASAKLSQWLIRPSVNDQGYYKHLKDSVTGEPLYRNIIELEDGSFDSEFVTTQFVEKNGKRIQLEPVKEWVGSHMEGMVWSMFDLFNIFDKNFKDYWSDEEYAYKRANLAIAGQEILLMLLLFWLISAMYPDEKPSDIDSFFERNAIIALNNSRQDLHPVNTILKGNISLDFTAYDFLDRLIPEVYKAAVGTATGEGNGSWYKVFTRFGISAPFRKNIYDWHQETISERK